MNNANSDVDIAIVGAGLVGTPLANVLSAQGWSVALLDANTRTTNAGQPQAQNAQTPDLNQRCTALSLGTRLWLESQNLWNTIADDACPISQVHVSHKGYFGSTRLNADELNADAVGYVVNNQTVNDQLVLGLSATSVRHVTGMRVNNIHVEDDGVRVYFGDTSLKARLLIAADGVSSTTRQSVGIQTHQVDYEQSAFLGTVQLEREHDNIAYERFTSSGPLALLPRPAKTMSFVDCVEPDERESIQSLSDDAYLQRLQQRFGYRLGDFRRVGPRIAVPLVRIEAATQVAERTVLLGNAMRLLHPVGGQGYNLAMRDVAQLCRSLQPLNEHDSSARDPGSAELLQQFSNTRKRDQQQVVQFTDTLARGFRGKASLPAHVRALGLLSLDTLSPLRKQFAQRTMGLG